MNGEIGEWEGCPMKNGKVSECLCALPKPKREDLSSLSTQTLEKMSEQSLLIPWPALLFRAGFCWSNHTVALYSVCPSVCTELQLKKTEQLSYLTSEKEFTQSSTERRGLYKPELTSLTS